MWRFLSALLLVVLPSLASAQNTGRIDGVVRDSATANPLANTNIVVEKI